MFSVALLSLVAVPLAQQIAANRTFSHLPPEFRQRVESRMRLGPGPKPPKPSKPMSEAHENEDTEEVDFFEEESSRLFALLNDYRAGQRSAVLVALALAFTLSALIAYLQARSVARPVSAVSRAAAALAAGDFASRVVVPKRARLAEEVEGLTRDFNIMATSLERYEGERKAMLADIAHELRNPLATLQLRVDALGDGIVPFNEEEAALLRAQIGLLSRLIDDLRLLSVAMVGRLELHKAPTAIDDFLAALLAQQQPAARAKNIRLTLQANASGTSLALDQDRMAQVVHNLLNNALRVTPVGGEIRVRSVQDALQVVISVQDSGPGIPPDELESVFARFVQGKRRDTRGESGSGLGLAIVQSLVHAHGGQVSAANDAATGGAVFTLSLPKDVA